MSHFATTTLKGKLSALQRVNNKLLVGRSDGFVEIIERCSNNNTNIKNKTFFEDTHNDVYSSSYVFKSHKSEFDYLESTEISEKISVLENIKIGDSFLNILTGNEKTIKLWNIRDHTNLYTNTDVKSDDTDDKTIEYEEEYNKNFCKDRERRCGINKYLENEDNNETHSNIYETYKNDIDQQFTFEKKNGSKDDTNKHTSSFVYDTNISKNKVTLDFNTEEILKKTILYNEPKKSKQYKNILYSEYKNAHQYTLNDIKSCEFTSSFISCDYLRINLYDIECMQSYNLIDIKPQKYDDLTFVITSLYTNKDMSFLYSTSKGEVFYQDMRINPRGKHAKTYVTLPNGDEVLKSICQIQVIDNILATRDLDSVNLFDLRNEKPLKSFNLLKNKKLDNLIESGVIYEKIRMQKNENSIITGGFDSTITVLNVNNYEVKETEVNTEFVKEVEFYEDGFVYGDNYSLYFYR